LRERRARENPLRALFRQRTLVAALALCAGVSGAAQLKPKTRVIGVKFLYDFSKVPGCPAKNAKQCVKQFNVYNLTDTGKRFLLFSIPAPKGANGKSQSISGKSKPLVLEPGKHLIAVSAVDNQGHETKPQACSEMVEVPPK
jgi:hypothetical protein